MLFAQGPLGTRLRRPDYGSPPPRSRPTPSEGSFVPPGRPRPSSGGGFGEPVATIEKVDTQDQDQRRRRPFGRPGQGGSVQLEQTDHHDHHHHDHEGPEKERPARKDVEDNEEENGEKKIFIRRNLCLMFLFFHCSFFPRRQRRRSSLPHLLLLPYHNHDQCWRTRIAGTRRNRLGRRGL